MNSQAVSPLIQALAHLLTRWRGERGWSLREVSERSGLSIPYLSELERARKAPSVDVLEHLAHAYGVSLAVLLRELASLLDRSSDSYHHLHPELREILPLLTEAEQEELVRYAHYLRWRRQQPQ
ncbi:MAG: helix-turn-helix transcriptional regulator [Thermorudis peleae]|nr:helix-turn-helix transcriptional regulator [Thermorudis peleae]